MWLSFEALPLARILAGFPAEKLDRMEVVVDTESKKMVVRLAGLHEAMSFLEAHGMRAGKHFRPSDAVDAAASLIIEMEAENP